MSNIAFAWDPRKAKSNLLKHGISFEEAQSVFLDDHARLIDDPDHSASESRFLLLGYSLRANCLVVTHCYRDESEMRLISARRASAHEEREYWSFQ